MSVVPAAATIVPGGTQALSASINASNCPTPPVVSWNSGASTIATVTAQGIVTGVAAGSAIITASAGGTSGTALITVSLPAVAAVNVTLGSASLAVGATTTATAVALSATNVVLTGRPLTWSSSNAQIASVSQAGVVTAVAPGTTTIRATVDGVVGQATVTVLAPMAITSIAPANGSSAVSIEAVIRVTFSTPVDPASVTATTVALSRGGTVVPATLSVNGNVVTVTPTAPLTEFNTAYTLVVTTGVRSTAGQSISSNGGAGFTTDFWDPNYYYRLTNQASGPGKSLDTYSNSDECFMGDTGGFTGQFWYFIVRPGGVYSMQNAYGGPAAGLEGADTGTPCYLHRDAGLPNEVIFSGMVWRAIAIPGIAGHYYLRPASTTTKSLGTIDLVPQLAVTPATPVAGSSQNWMFTRLGRRP